MFNYNDVEGASKERLSAQARKQLQGNLLSSAKGTHSTQEFVRFESSGNLREWLSLCKAKLTNNVENHNLLITAQGLRKLGAAEATLQAMDPAFRRGARSSESRKKLRDPELSEWQAEHQPEWDAAFLTKSNAHVPLQASALSGNSGGFREAGASLDAKGDVLTNASADKYSHFGYKDGFTSPIFTPEAVPVGQPGYDMRRKLSVLLVPDPLVGGAPSFGTYFVFRKYKLHVERFETTVTSIVDELLKRHGNGPDGDGDHHIPDQASRFPFFRGANSELERDRDKLREKVTEWIVGTNRNGENSQLGPGNGFSHEEDIRGLKCPFHAHIRKMNPRGATGDLAFEHTKTLTRRGISYGSKNDAEKGVLFWCAQASIEDQFEYVQQRWANNDGPDFSRRPTPEIDALIGRPDPNPTAFENVNKPYPETDRYTRWKSTIDVNFDIWPCSQLVASEYFFAPSLAGLERLCTFPAGQAAGAQS